VVRAGVPTRREAPGGGGSAERSPEQATERDLMNTIAEEARTGHDLHGQGGPKDVTIVVNGREKKVAKEDISFEEIVALSGLPSNPNTIFTVTYRRGHGNKEGTLVEGESVKVKEGMIFNVTATDKS
jgi:hypothetical protein